MRTNHSWTLAKSEKTLSVGLTPGARKQENRWEKQTNCTRVHTRGLRVDESGSQMENRQSEINYYSHNLHM